MSSIFGQIELEQLKNEKKKKKKKLKKEGRKKKRREKKEKNLRAGVGAIINTQDIVYRHQISFYRLERLPI